MNHHTQQQYHTRRAALETLSQRLMDGCISENEYWLIVEQYWRAENKLLTWAMQELGIVACPNAQRSSIVLLVSEWSNERV